MISTKNIIVDYTEVPSTWVFEHYCKLNKKLTGQGEKIKSLFNKKDKEVEDTLNRLKTKEILQK